MTGNIMEELISFIIPTKSMKYLGLNLMGFFCMKTISKYIRLELMYKIA